MDAVADVRNGTDFLLFKRKCVELDGRIVL